MKLYYSPGACSLSPHIALRAVGAEFELVRVDTRTKKLLNGDDFLAINPKGYVPTLELDDGEILTEGPAIVQYIADHHPDAHLAPENGTMARTRLQEWLNFITTELHKQYSPLFSASSSEEVKAAQRAMISRRIEYVAAQLGHRPFLLGETYSVADGYLFTVLRWSKWVNIDLSPWPVIVAYMARVAALPAVHAAMAAEGLKG